MKILLTIIIIISFLQLRGQQTITGLYSGYNSQLLINTDSTFFISNQGDLSYAWAKGTWNTNNDTIQFEFIPINDTLTEVTSNNLILKKSLVISCDEIANSIRLVNNESKQYQERIFEIYMCQKQQVRSIVPTKLLIKKNKLYFFDNSGNPIKKRHRSMETNKKILPGYRKVK